MNTRLFYMFLLILLPAFSCNKKDNGTGNGGGPGNNNGTGPLTGFNVRWRNVPPFSAQVLGGIASLKPKLLRYPGGTVAHSWNWRTGEPTTGMTAVDYPHPIADVKKMRDATGADMIFVLDVVNSTLEDQTEMLTASAVPVKYIELGNELYAPEYATRFPDGKAYADSASRWAASLKARFPGVKIGAVMFPRIAGSGNPRAAEWNGKVYANINKTVIDAFIYHIYVDATESVAARKAEFVQAFLSGTGKECWITEYGARSGNGAQSLELARYAESVSSIALNHCIISGSGDMSKFTPSFDYTDEGLVFLAKANSGVSFYKETFENPPGAAGLLSSVMGMKTLLNGQTVDPNTVIQFTCLPGQNAFPGAANLSAYSDNGLRFSYTSSQVPALFGKIDNLVVTPKLEKDGPVTVKLDMAYDYRSQNTAQVQVYWSDNWNGSSAFQESQWKLLATETAASLFTGGVGENQFSRRQYSIQPAADFYVAIRVSQTVDATAWRSQWKFDNLVVSNR